VDEQKPSRDARDERADKQPAEDPTNPLNIHVALLPVLPDPIMKIS
jgi:hypothetical protein